MTLADLGVMVAGVALVMAIPSRASAWPLFLPPPSILFLAVIGGLQLTVGFGLVLALVVLFRRARYGGPVRPAERLALGLAALRLLDVVPNLDEAVNAYYAAVGSKTLEFGVARWLLSAPAATGVVLVVAGSALLQRRARDGSRAASSLAVVGIVGGLCLWFWGPCQVARLELPWLLVPSPQGDPLSWGWRGSVVDALRAAVATGPEALTWGLLVAATIRPWWADRRRGRAPARVWTERAAIADATVAALLLTLVGPQGSVDLALRVTWLVGIGLLSWGIAGCLGLERDLAAPTRSTAETVKADPLSARTSGRETM